MPVAEGSGGIQWGGAAVVKYVSLGSATERMFARITDYFHYAHSWVEVERAPVDYGTWATTQSYIWADKPSGMSGEFNLFSRNSYPNIPLGSVVEIYAEADGTWACNYDLDHFTATVLANSGGGDYVVTEKYPVGEEISNPRTVTASEDNFNSTVPIGTEVLVWSQYKERDWVYHFAYPKAMKAPPDGCGECTEVLIDVDITQEITVGVEGVQYFVYSTSDGSMVLYQWVCVPEQFCGWFDLCACQWVPWWCTDTGCFQFVDPPGGATGPFTSPEDCAIACDTVGPYWCTSGGCIQAAAAPPGTISGPYDTIEECEAACTEPSPWWCTPGGCVQSETEPVDSLGGPYTSEMECVEACGTIPSPCPEGVAWRVATIDATTGDCDCLPPTLDYLGGAGPLADWSSATCEGNPAVALYCIDDTLVLTVNGTSAGITCVDFVADPPSVTFVVGDRLNLCGGSTGGFTVTITPEP